MKKIKEILFKPAFLLFVSAVLLAASTLGSAQAALTYYSENYAAEVTVSSIGVSLLENGGKVSWRDYRHQNDQWNEQKGRLLEYLKDQEGNYTIVPGREYQERLSVHNSGDIDAYVRVILYRDWQNEKGERDTTLSPELIELNLLKNQGWIEDKKASTRERTILYYTKVLLSGAETSPLSDTLKISSDIAEKVIETVSVNQSGGKKYKTITTEYLYNGYQFNLTAEVDAVQTHNAQEAIKSAWGIDVDAAEDGTLTLHQ